MKNLILNVSAVVWRRDALLAALEACQEELRGYRMAGDWRLYLQALAAPGARIAYEATPLNVHRRHAESVTHALKADRHVAEIARCHALARGSLPGRRRRGAPGQQGYLREVAAQLGRAAGRDHRRTSGRAAPTKRTRPRPSHTDARGTARQRKAGPRRHRHRRPDDVRSAL